MSSQTYRARPGKLSKQFQHNSLLLVVAIFIFSLPMLPHVLRLREPGMRMWFFDVGQGDGILIETPHGQQILVDGGPDQTVLQKLPSVMWPWDRTIEAMFVTHPDADHITGLVSVLERYEVKTIYETGVRGGTHVIEELERAIKNEQSEQRIVRSGASYEFDGVFIDIVWPTSQATLQEKDRNNTSIVIRVRYGTRTVLLTGDAEGTVEDDFAKTVGDVDVLKVGHHGSRTSTSIELLQTIRPEVAVISAGEDNRYGHPHPIILSRLENIKAKIWRTDLDGDLLLFTDGLSIQTSPVFLPF